MTIFYLRVVYVSLQKRSAANISQPKPLRSSKMAQVLHGYLLCDPSGFFAKKCYNVTYLKPTTLQLKINPKTGAAVSESQPGLYKSSWASSYECIGMELALQSAFFPITKPQQHPFGVESSAQVALARCRPTCDAVRHREKSQLFQARARLFEARPHMKRVKLTLKKGHRMLVLRHQNEKV